MILFIVDYSIDYFPISRPIYRLFSISRLIYRLFSD